jgi:hypothetical protein
MCEAFDYKCETFRKTTRLFEEIFNKTEAISRFSKQFPNKWRFIWLMGDTRGDILEDFILFKYIFKEMEAFV